MTHSTTNLKKKGKKSMMSNSFKQFEDCEWNTLTKSRDRSKSSNFISIFKNGILNFSEAITHKLEIEKFKSGVITWSYIEDQAGNEAACVKIKFIENSEETEYPIFTFCHTKTGNRFFNIRKLLKNIDCTPTSAIRLQQQWVDEIQDFSHHPYFIYNSEKFEMFMVLPTYILNQSK